MTNIVSFPALGLEFNVHPVAFSIGGLHIYWYGIIIAAAFGLALLYCMPRAKKLGLNADRVVDVVIAGTIGGVVGAVVAVAVLQVLLAAFGPDAFGSDRQFVAAQASVVATMVGGVPHGPAFAVGLAAGFALYLVGFPAMMLGLGVYLPFYLSLTGFLGALAKVAYDRVGAWRRRGLSPEERARAEADAVDRGLIIASGLMGGESVVGIVLAMIVAAGALAG